MKLQNILGLFIVLLITGGLYYFINVPTPPDTQKVQQYVWMIDMENIDHIVLALPRDGMSESFIKISNKDQFPWFFDDANQTPIDTVRWGGGIPLLLSGPGIGRVIARGTSDSKLEEFGLTNPRMLITLNLDSGEIMKINVGDPTPSGDYYYVQAPNTRDVALVDHTWYDVLAKLVTDPPYINAVSDNETETANATSSN